MTYELWAGSRVIHLGYAPRGTISGEAIFGWFASVEYNPTTPFTPGLMRRNPKQPEGDRKDTCVDLRV